MTARTTETTVAFTRSFKLSSFGCQQSAGTYRLVIDKEEIVGLSFLAYQRTATMLHTSAISILKGRHQVFLIDPLELATALEADAHA